MTPKEKAQELLSHYNSILIDEISHGGARGYASYKCASITVNEILLLLNEIDYDTYSHNAIVFYNEVKQEIEKL
jgi:hypothetical protein